MPGRRKRVSDKSLTADTIAFWSDHAGVTYSPTDAEEAAANITALFDLLNELSRNQKGGGK